uniref:Uncharacterized protein n=1 Tax=Anguilla anguilla TaxID=7936 RepID=A0A0E9RCV3_ANGAN
MVRLCDADISDVLLYITDYGTVKVQTVFFHILCRLSFFSFIENSY